MSETFDVVLEKKEKRSFHVPGVLADRKDFDGPLDLLLFLISKNDANVYDIPISLITEQYIEYLETHKAEIDDLADFYRLAAELLYIKTKLLLPQQTELDEEYEDPRQDLVERLIDYQKFKKYTDLLTGVDKSGRLYIDRPENMFAIPFEDKELFQGVTLEDLCKTFSEILSKTPPSKIFNIYQPVSVKEKRALMMELLDEKDEIAIEDLIVDYENPLHIICAFMSILEAAKDHFILFRQDVLYGSIKLVKRPQDWDPALVDQYDKEADVIEENKLSDPEDFSILTREAEMRLDDLIHKKHEEEGEDEEEEESYEFIGDEEDIDLDEDDDE
ncbi:MAG: segregation/condensation protein A [Spirochaetales bacterium]|nr:segregation/condensation protein A [Candidatus Physcosoma equi]